MPAPVKPSELAIEDPTVAAVISRCFTTGRSGDTYFTVGISAISATLNCGTVNTIVVGNCLKTFCLAAPFPFRKPSVEGVGGVVNCTITVTRDCGLLTLKSGETFPAYAADPRR